MVTIGSATGCPRGQRSISRVAFLSYLMMIIQIWTLPKLLLAFSTSALASLQSVLTDTHDPPVSSPPQDPPRKPQDLDIEQILLGPVGETSLVPHLCVSRNWLSDMAVLLFVPCALGFLTFRSIGHLRGRRFRLERCRKPTHRFQTPSHISPD